MVAVDRRAVGGAQATRIEQVFVGDRQPIEQAARQASRPPVVRRARRRQYLLARDVGDDRVDLGIDAVNLREVGFHHLDRRRLSGVHEGAQFSCGKKAEVAGCHFARLSCEVGWWATEYAHHAEEALSHGLL